MTQQAAQSSTSETPADAAIVEKIEDAGAKMRRVQEMAGKVIFGQEQVIERTLLTLISGGHALLIGVPGVAKTSLVETLGSLLDLDNKRIQFTPDLMPSDIIGSEVLEDHEGGRRSFRFIKGPVFTQLLMADEINRASPKTQSALLQAMQENHATVAGERHEIPTPFHVLATQNPLEQEGTYPLPEAQLDRFLMQIDMGYPDEVAERRMLLSTTGIKDTELSAVLSGDDLLSIQRLNRQIPVGENVVSAILKIVRAARPDLERTETDVTSQATQHIAWGPGPRASQAFMMAARAKAMFDGRLAPSVDDVISLAEPILKHRMALTFAARAEGLTTVDVISQLTSDLAL